MNGKRNLVVGVVAVVAIAAGAWAFRMRSSTGPARPDAAVELFYQQNLRDATGTTRAMADHRGKVVVVNFWATWCVPCVQEIPAFSKANADAAGRVTFVGLGIDSPSNIAGFADRLKPSYPLLIAGASGTELARAFGNATGALPYTVVIDTDGKVIESHLGRVDDALLQRWLAPHLAAAARPSDQRTR